jgi:hypothetical protein
MEKQSQDGKDEKGEKGERQTTWREAQPGEAETFFSALRLTGVGRVLGYMFDIGFCSSGEETGG